jgi:phage terminase large subunit-like protein
VDLSSFDAGMRSLHMDSVAPQQLVIAGVLEAESAPGVPLYDEVAIEVPRRGAKTTSIWAVLLGRCQSRPGYKVVTTAQSGLKARERFLEVARTLQRNNVGGYRVLRGAGAESIEWGNGSRLWVVPPLGDAFRGDAADVILFDESQEYGPELTADLLGGALALMDTRKGGQVIVAGTAGRARAGMLWDYLESGRQGRSGIVEYAAPDTADPTDEAVWWAAHPGLGTLTTIEKVRARFDKLPRPQFQREYLGQWPYDINTRAINPDDWAAGRVPAWPAAPARFALGYDIAPDQSCAALVAAWRDTDGLPWVEVVRHGLGDAWLPKEIHDWSRRHTGLRVGYDNIHAGNVAVADRLERARPKPKLVPLGTAQITAAAAQLAQDITEHRLRFKVDPALEAAVDVATRRTIGDASWAWGRRRSGGDISALVAATNALKVFDLDTRPANRVGMVTSRKPT